MVLVQYILAVSFTFPNRNLEHSETRFRLHKSTEEVHVLAYQRQIELGVDGYIDKGN